jgi:hypothetical protein
VSSRPIALIANVPENRPGKTRHGRPSRNLPFLPASPDVARSVSAQQVYKKTAYCFRQSTSSRPADTVSRYPRQTHHDEELETPLHELKHLAPNWSPVPFFGFDSGVPTCPRLPCSETMRRAPQQMSGDPALRVALVDSGSRTPERQGRQEAPASHQEERGHHGGGLRPACRHEDARQTTQQEPQHRLAQ